MIQTRTALRIFVSVVLLSYLFTIVNKTSYKKTPVGVIHMPVQTRSIVKTVSDKVSENITVPRHYREMETLSSTFKKSLQSGNPKWENLLKLGDVYATGVFPFLRPDDLCAQQCYTVVAKCPSPEHASQALSKLVNIRYNPVERVDRQGESIDPSYSTKLCKTTNKYIKSLPPDEFRKNKNRYDPETIVLPVHVPKSKPKKQTTTVGRRNRPRRINIGLGSDKQNVHDHGVSSAIKTNIERLKKEYINTKHHSDEKIVENAMQICKEIREKSKTDKNVTFTSDDLADAHNVIVSLTPDQYSSTGLTQVQILGRILQKIEDISKDNKNVGQGVKETLCKRLASGVENGSTVCATGKISRALSVFEGVLEDSQKAVSMDVVRKELSHLAEKVRKDYLGTVGSEGRKAYDTIASVPQYSLKMKEIFMGKVREQYIDTLGMNSKIIDPIASVYADAY